MPLNRRSRRALKYPQGINLTDASPPFVARLPLIQPALVHFFSHQMSSNHWCHLIRTELNQKKIDNEYTLSQVKIYNELINTLSFYAQTHPHRPHLHRFYLKLDSDIYKNKIIPELVPDFHIKYVLPFIVIFLCMISIDSAVQQGDLDKRWAIDIQPEKNFPHHVPNTFFSFIMSLLVLASASYLALEYEERKHNIAVKPSLAKLKRECPALNLYPEALLDACTKKYDRHISGENPLNEAELHELLKRVKAIQKTTHEQPTPTPPEAAPNERSPRRRLA